MFYEKDLFVFFKEFAQDIYLENGKKFRAIFDNNTDINDFNNYSTVSTKPELTVSKIDVEKYNLKKNDILYIDEVKYSIDSVVNETGISKIALTLE